MALPTYLPTYLPSYLLTYLPTYQPMALFVFNATITHPSTRAYLKHFLSLYIYPIPLVDVKNIIWEKNNKVSIGYSFYVLHNILIKILLPQFRSRFDACFSLFCNNINKKNKQKKSSNDNKCFSFDKSCVIWWLCFARCFHLGHDLVWGQIILQKNM